MATGQLISLGIYFVAMLAIGVYAWRTSTDDLEGYMLGGRKLGPWVTSLSAGAADMSGWLLLGLPGAMYVAGLSASWIAIGLFIGAFTNWLVVAPRLRVHTELADDSITIPDFFENRFADASHALRMISAVVIILFFTLYTSSGMVAGGKFFESAFGADYSLGLWLTAGVVIAYTLIGGFMAVSLTDAVQGAIMFAALVMVPLVALADLGGLGTLGTTLDGIDPGLTDMLGGATAIAVISALAWGLGYFGQPHIIVRFMAISSVRAVPRAMTIGMSWMAVTLIGALATGLVGLAYATANGLAVDDPETIFIVLSQLLFHPLVAGFLLAAILAAIMSTISSQLLVSSSSLTEDFYAVFLRREASQKELVLVGRASVLTVALVAILLAYSPDSNVLGLVANAWAGFGAAFGPIVLLALCWRRMTRAGAIAGMVVGAATVLVWVYAPLMAGGASLSVATGLYEIVPGFVLCALTAIVVSLATPPPPAEVLATFDRAQAARRAGEISASMGETAHA